VPVVQEVIKPLPAIFLPNRADFPETVDGLVFGVAAGLGFSLAETLINFSSTIASLPVHVAPGNWIYSLATIAVLQPLQPDDRTIEPHDSPDRYTALGVECIAGEAFIRDPFRVEVNGRVLTTRTIVVATHDFERGRARSTKSLCLGTESLTELQNTWF